MKQTLTKFIKSQKTGEYVEIGPSDMDFNTRFALTKEQLIAERNAIIRVVGNPGIKISKRSSDEFNAIINKARKTQGLMT